MTQTAAPMAARAAVRGMRAALRDMRALSPAMLAAPAPRQDTAAALSQDTRVVLPGRPDTPLAPAG
jgi:hypothetical protein